MDCKGGYTTPHRSGLRALERVLWRNWTDGPAEPLPAIPSTGTIADLDDTMPSSDQS